MNKEKTKGDGAKYIIENAPVTKTILLLVVPALLGSIVGQVNFLLDSFFLNKVTYTDTQTLQVAVAAAFPISLILLAFATLFGIGGSIYGARILGEGKEDKARSIFTGTVIYGILLNVILMIILMIFLVPLLELLGAKDPTTLKYAYSYASIMIVGSMSLFLGFIFAMFARSEGKAGLVLFAILFQTITNVVLNYLFIIPMQMGAGGASLATVISQFTQVIIIGVFFFTSKSSFRFTAKFKKYYGFEDFKSIVFLGIPATLGIALLTVTAALLQIQAVKYADEALKASIGVLVKFFTVFTMLIQAAASGIQPVFSYAYGAQDEERFLSVSHGYLKISMLGGVLVGFLLILFPYSLANLLGFDGNVARDIMIGTYGFGVMLFIMPASFLQQVLFQSLNDAKSAFFIVVFRQLIVFLVLSIVMNQVLGEVGLLLAQQTSIVVGSVITIVLMQRRLKLLQDRSFGA